MKIIINFFRCMFTGARPKPGDCGCIFYCAGEDTILSLKNKLKIN